jgi:hypothetical protein
LAESEDVLIADPRGQMTPAQMVDQKLLALLGSCPRSLQPDNRQAESGLRSPSSATRMCLRQRDVLKREALHFFFVSRKSGDSARVKRTTSSPVTVLMS